MRPVPFKQYSQHAFLKESAMRTEVPSEKKLHRAMKRYDIGRGAAHGAVVGGLAGALKHHPGAGAAAGAVLGAALGHLRGEERTLKDTTKQERQHQRREERMHKKSEHEAMMAGFHDRIVKEASFFTSLGSKALGTLTNVGSRLATKGGRVGEMAGKATQSLIGQAAKHPPGEFARRVGMGLTAAGGVAAGAAGTGYVAGRMR